ncbi:hypothetical protein HJC99_06255 [Candidatus Saccharibacteria bacterium]|nr:hypothetical protein [Candidatus Saccharibacteria bacterium]
MKLVFPKLLGYSAVLLIVASAQLVLLVKLMEAPGKPPLVGTIFLTLFVGSQLLLALSGIVFSFRPRGRGLD